MNKSLKKPLFDCSKLGDFYDCGCGDEEDKAAAGAGKKADTKTKPEIHVTDEVPGPAPLGMGNAEAKKQSELVTEVEGVEMDPKELERYHTHGRDPDWDQLKPTTVMIDKDG